MTEKTPLRHRIDCDGNDRHLRAWRGRTGEAMLACSRCRRATPVDMTAAAAAPQPADAIGQAETAEPPTAPIRSSRFACREHHRPVDRRGHGCHQCDHPQPTKPRDPFAYA